MNRYTEFHKSALIAVAVIMLTGKPAAADEPPVAGARPLNANIVVATARLPSETEGNPASQEDMQDAAVAEAIEAMIEDNKLELDLRLSGHKSVILAGDRSGLRD